MYIFSYISHINNRFYNPKIWGYGSKNGMILIIILNTKTSYISILLTVTLNILYHYDFLCIYLFCLAAVTTLQRGEFISILP